MGCSFDRPDGFFGFHRGGDEEGISALLCWPHHVAWLSWEGPVCAAQDSAFTPGLYLPYSLRASRPLFLEVVARLEGSQVLEPEVRTLRKTFLPLEPPRGLLPGRPTPPRRRRMGPSFKCGVFSDRPTDKIFTSGTWYPALVCLFSKS